MVEENRLTLEGLIEREGYMTIEEAVALKDLATTLPENPRVLNIGSGMGTSALALLEARDDLYIHSIDTEDDSHLGSLRREREALQEAELWDTHRIKQIHGDSREVGKTWFNGNLDMVFVDDGHYYEHVKGDIETWLPFIRNGGLMVFHDYKGQYDMGVGAAIDELMTDHKRVAHVHTLVAFEIKKTGLTSEGLTARWRERFLDFDVIKGLKELTRSLDPDPTIINLGAGFGTSALVFLEAREDTHVVTVDAQQTAKVIGSLIDERWAMEEAGFWGSPRYEQILGISQAIGKNWDRGEVDMVFVDASHSYVACKGDAVAWLPHIKDGGIIAFHDYWERYGYEVIKAVDEVMAGYERIMLVSCLIAFKVKKQI